MSDKPVLTPNVLVGGVDPAGRAKAYLARVDGSEDAHIAEDMTVLALNGATARIERITGRRLRARTYRTAATIASVTTTANSRTATGAGFNALKVDDDAVGANLSEGTRIASIESDTSLTLTRGAATSGAASVTFGSDPLVISGDGTAWLQIPQFPVIELYSVKSIDLSGVKTAIDLATARLVKSTGRVFLPNASFPSGEENIEVECRAGYRPGSEIDEFNDLEQACLRLCQVMWQDYRKSVGRTGDINVVQFAQHIQSFEMPADVGQALRNYERLWG